MGTRMVSYKSSHFGARLGGFTHEQEFVRAFQCYQIKVNPIFNMFMDSKSAARGEYYVI